MTATQKIKKEILLDVLHWINEGEGSLSEREQKVADMVLDDNKIDEQYDMLVEAGLHYDVESDFREGEVETGLPCDWSRHYEAKSVAAKMSDGSWVGWVYWYGGGKHGNPDEIEWMEDAYDLEVTETEELVVVREYKKIEK